MDIAIIGIAGRFPLAKDITEFYQRLSDGYDAVRELSQSRLSATSLPLSRKYLPLAFMEDVDKFDFSFFNISRAEAEQMDPRQRIMLEEMHHLFEDAGYPATLLQGRAISIFFGDTRLDYYHHASVPNPLLHIGVMNPVIAGRVARFYDLRGAAMMIDTSCSSSLVAVAKACEDLVLGNAEMAVAGAINLNLFPGEDNVGLVDVAAPDGKAKVFSDKADGTGGGEAVGCILVKPLDNAIRDNDRIHAIIKGFAINQDAALSASITAPDSRSQSEVIIRAIEKAQVTPRSIGYIEAHGTGTKLGDPIEVEGITKAFRKYTADKQFCALSSVKSNIGHTDCAAGIVGLIKAVLSLKYKTLFPSIHFSGPNPFIDFANSPVFVNTAFKPWKSDAVRRAGVSSFGMMGTNCHVILEESNELPPSLASDEELVFTFSAKTPTSLKKNVVRQLAFIKANEHLSIKRYAYTLTACRNHYPLRTAVVASNREKLIEALESWISKVTINATSFLKPSFVFLCSDFKADGTSLPNAIESDHSFISLLKDAEDRFLQLGYNKDVLQQYTYLQMLVSLGLDITKGIGVGTGNSALLLLSGSLSSNGSHEPTVSDESLAARVKTFIQSQHQRPLILIDVLPGGNLGRVASEVIQEAKLDDVMVVQQTRSEASLLAIIARIYTAGCPINWQKFHQKSNTQVLDIPGYQFDDMRAWLKAPSWNAAGESHYYSFTWIPSLTNQATKRTEGKYLIFGDKAGLSAAIKSNMEAQGAIIISVQAGHSFNMTDMSNYQIQYDNPDHFRLLLRHLAECSNHDLAGVIVCNAFEPTSELNNSNDSFRNPNTRAGAWTQVNFAKVFQSYLDQPNFAYVLVTGNSCNANQSPIIPAQAMLGSFARTLLSDHPTLRLRHVDFELDAKNLAVLAGCITYEINSSVNQYFCAYRNGTRYSQEIRRYLVTPGSSTNIIKGGLFLVTGGATGVGYALAKGLALQGARHLVILGRTPIHDSNNSQNETERIRSNNINELKGVTKVTYVNADVAKEEDIKRTYELLESFGKFDGIIHAAGERISHRPIQDYSSDELILEIAAKTKGTQNLLRIPRTEHGKLVLISSLNAIVPQKNSTAYTLANGYLDALADTGEIPNLLSIGWPGWTFKPTQSAAGLREIFVDQGVNFFLELLSSTATHVTVMDIDWKSFNANPFFTLAEELVPRIEKVKAGKPEVSQIPEQDLTQNIIHLYQTVLRSEAVKENDDFFEIGGHSLNATQVLNSLNQQYNIALQLDDMYEQATPRQLGNLIKDFTAKQTNFQPAEIERELEAIWTEVLKLTPISKSDNFFDIGGHSLNATQVINRIFERWQIKLEIDHFYDYQTLGELSAFIAKQHIATHADQTHHTPLKYYPLSHQQRRLWAASKLRNDSHIYNMYSSYRLTGDLDVTALSKAFHAIVEKHEILRTNFVTENHLPVQVISPFERARFAIQSINLKESNVENWLSDVLAHPFDLERDPLVKMSLAKTGDQTYVFAIVLHHIIADGWSMQILFAELIQNYRKAIESDAVAWSPLPVQYKEFALSQQNAELNRESSEFWRNVFKTTPVQVRLPIDRQHEDKDYGEGEVYTEYFEPEFSTLLEKYCQRLNISSFMASLAAVFLLIRHYNGQDDLILGTTSAGRQHKDLEEQIGLHLNLLPIRVNLTNNESIESILLKVKSMTLNAIRHQSYPFQQIVEDLKLESRKGQTPLFNVLVEYRNLNLNFGSNKPDQLDGIRVTRISMPQNFARFELSVLFDMTEQGLSTAIEYSSASFDKETIALMMSKLVLILRKMVENSSLTLKQFDDKVLAQTSTKSERLKFNF